MLVSTLLLFVCYVLGAHVETKVSPWNKEAPVPGLPTDACSWIPINATSESVEFRMCIRPFSDVVSNVIRLQGRWIECDELLTEWQTNVATHRNDSIFVDVGANIGSCTLLLSSNGVRSCSFEPSASNLFYFTSSLFHGPASTRALTEVYPIALGEHRAVSTLFSQAGNLGNSVVGKPVGEEDSQNEAMRNVRFADWWFTAIDVVCSIHKQSSLIPLTTCCGRSLMHHPRQFR